MTSEVCHSLWNIRKIEEKNAVIKIKISIKSVVKKYMIITDTFNESIYCLYSIT